MYDGNNPINQHLKQYHIEFTLYIKDPMIACISNNISAIDLLAPTLEQINCMLLRCFKKISIDIINDIIYKLSMRDASYFIKPGHDWQRRYEALRASFVERLPAKVVADRFGYTPAYVSLLRHLFTHEKIDFSEPVLEGKIARRRVNSEVRQKIRHLRERRLSAGEITQLLSEEGIELSSRTVERVLAEEGFPKLPRRSRLKIGLTVK